MSIQEKINQIIENFSYFDNWEDRYEYVIDLGKKIPKIDMTLMIDEFKVQGCASNLWVVPEVNGNVITFNGASDSVIVQGLFAILSNVYSGATAEEIINNPPTFLVKFFKEQKNLKNINCFSDEGLGWEKSSLQFDRQTLKVTFRDKFLSRRGRINCSLNDNGVWRWFGVQFVIDKN